MRRGGTALVTGASSGIGAIYADRLAGRGHDLLLVARDLKRLADLAGQISKAHGITVEVQSVDLGRAEGVCKIVAQLANDGGISMLVNAASVGPRGSFLGSEPADLAELVDLNVTALHDLTVAAAHAFAARGDGAIINIASAAALMPEHFNASYVASKAFVLALTQALASDLSKSGVRLQAVLPGFARTDVSARPGISFHANNPEMVMDVAEMVDAALAGFDMGETVTIPSLADVGLWKRYEQSRHAMVPYMSLRNAAARFRRPHSNGTGR